MSLRSASLALVVLVGLVGGCQRMTPEQCEKICWRVNELGFWERFEAEAKSLAPDARATLRAERQKTWDEMRGREFDPGLDNCVRECRKGAKPEDVACVDKATTFAAASACLTAD